MENQDEVIIVKLPRKDYDMLRQMIDRAEVYSWLTAKLRASWVWLVAGGVLSLILIWKEIGFK